MTGIWPLGIEAKIDARLADEFTPDTDNEKLSSPEDVVRRIIRNAKDGLISTAVTGIGNVTRTLEQSIRDISYNVKHYGAVAGSDISVALQKTIDACSVAGGGTVFIPAGAYNVSSEISIPSNVLVRGAGRGNTTLILTSTISNLFNSGNSNMFSIMDMTLDCSVAATKTAGAFIACGAGSVIVLRNIEMLNPLNGIVLTGTVSVWINEVEIAGVKQTTGSGVIIDGGNDHYLNNVFVKSASSSINYLAAFQIQATGGTWLMGCGALWATNGLLLNPGNGKTVEHLFCSMNAYDTGVYGISIAPTGTGIVRRNFFFQDWASTNSEIGISIASGGSTTVDGNQFHGCRVIQNAKHGVSLTGGINFFFAFGEVMGNSGASSGTYDGINVAANVTQFSLIGNRCGAHAGYAPPGTQRYGIAVAAGTSNRYRITGNDCHDNLSGAISDGGTGAVKQVNGNIPIAVTERHKAGGIDFYVNPVTGWQAASDLTSFTIASGAEIVIATGSGLIILTDSTTGSTGLFLLGGGGVAYLGQSSGAVWAATSTPSASQIGVYYSSGYRIKNGTAATVTLFAATWKTRPAN